MAEDRGTTMTSNDTDRRHGFRASAPPCRRLGRRSLARQGEGCGWSAGPRNPRTSELLCQPRTHVRPEEPEKAADVTAEDDLKKQFEAAQEFVKKENSWSHKVPTERKLNLYKFYKQFTEGDCTGDRPGMFSFEARKKWDAWDQVRGKSKEECMQGYIDELESQKKEFGE
ncbi:unnamed protein product [Prorocentrum cordatum]|uniref:ACB domain-containing protein n=1 Tax=Prorocentrum cordatum TaxID=2364126 RepID=A0ABN9SJ28_9DINO|nr:unnamed protein product [Polarella glacialis]